MNTPTAAGTRVRTLRIDSAGTVEVTDDDTTR
ncbi:putative secreted protein [Amycolatopsis endophytica]|uniref:Putative secreted protein n=1 Tax=Amycolatopsis endophytica TaxID=860233 RepID=A0A853B7G8_9PSEU|nr:putative secreted protein [Amycolatopsis endophytica]